LQPPQARATRSSCNAGSASGYEFVNTFPRYEGEFDGSGEGSTFTVMFGGRVLPSELSDPTTIKFDE
jgi:hypothetical protein